MITDDAFKQFVADALARMLVSLDILVKNTGAKNATEDTETTFGPIKAVIEDLNDERNSVGREYTRITFKLENGKQAAYLAEFADSEITFEDVGPKWGQLLDAVGITEDTVWEGYDMVVGKEVMVTGIITELKDGRKYNNIRGISPV